ncbi:MAG: ABC transporter ATP-binding protein [Gemmatimonadaceae bacterium]
MIRFERVTVRYRRAATPAVNGVTFEAASGALTAVVGPNGSGKSTLVRALIRREPIASGEITVDGRAVGAYDRLGLARRLAVVTQREEAPAAQTVYDAIALGRFPHTGPWRGLSAEDGRAVDRAAELAGVGDLARRSTAELSGGEWQRVRLARALAQGGDALVLDEPTTFLDIAHEMAMFELFASLVREGQAVVVVSHQLNLVARFADVVVLLREGEVVAAGRPGDVMRGSTLEEVYGWPLVVVRDPAVGAPALLPLRRRAPQ